MHDTGHSLFSHASERVYKKLPFLIEASRELTNITGKEKGSGEVLSFSSSTNTNSVAALLERGSSQLLPSIQEQDYSGPVDLLNVALLIVGRSRHPHLQFLGDIVSSAFDADKLDYLLRDATAAGLPLRYDLDRYLYGVQLLRGETVDGESKLEQLYEQHQRTSLDDLRTQRTGCRSTKCIAFVYPRPR